MLSLTYSIKRKNEREGRVVLSNQNVDAVNVRGNSCQSQWLFINVNRG